MNLILLLHVLLMASLLGLLWPDIVLRAAIHRSETVTSKLALVRLGVTFSLFSGYLLLAVVATGIWRTLEVGYPWFSLVTIWWLAVKQIVGLLLVVWVIAGLPKIHKLHASFRAVTDDDQAAILLRRCHSAVFWHHTTLGLSWVLSVLGIMKPLFFN